MLTIQYDRTSDKEALFLEQLNLENKVVVVNGTSGSGKTMLLQKMGHLERKLSASHHSNILEEVPQDAEWVGDLLIKYLKANMGMIITTQCVDTLPLLIKNNVDVLINCINESS